MEKNPKMQGPAGRTEIKELPKAKKQLSKSEQKKINGGGGMAGLISGARRPQD